MSRPDAYLERRLTKLMQGRATIRAAGAVIVSFTVLTVLVSGAVMRVFDHSEFETYGEALWWALQTVTTVGYGDIVPHDTLGRVVGAVVMLQGIAFLTVVTAVITSIFVERARRERVGVVEPSSQDIQGVLLMLEQRLARIEERLAER